LFIIFLFHQTIYSKHNSIFTWFIPNSNAWQRVFECMNELEYGVSEQKGTIQDKHSQIKDEDHTGKAQRGPLFLICVLFRMPILGPGASICILVFNVQKAPRHK
jgi:hypothetical protein